MIKKEIIKQVKENLQLRLSVAIALNVGERTIINYCDTESENLTKAAALRVIRDYTGLTDEQILEPEKQHA